MLGLSYAQRPFFIGDIVTQDKTLVGSAGCGPDEYSQALDMMLNLDLDAYLQCILPIEQFRDGWKIFRDRTHIKVLLAAEVTQKKSNGESGSGG